MRSLMLALPLIFGAASARAEPTSTLNGLWQLLGSCAQSVGGPAASVGSEVTLLFSIKRDGSLQGQPRITHSKLVGDDETQKAFLSGVLASVARCFPLPITDGLGGAVAGRPLRIRVMNRPKERGVQVSAVEVAMAKLVYTRLQDHPRETYFATSGSLIVGRIDCICASPAAAEQWMWGMQLDIGATPFRRGATVGSRGEATAALEAAWVDWKLWAGLQDSNSMEPEVASIAAPTSQVLAFTPDVAMLS